MSSSSSSHQVYPIGTAVVITGLQKAAEHNGKSAIVETLPAAGTERQQVRLTDESSRGGLKLAVKPANLQLQPRPADSLSIKELKYIITETSKGENKDDSSFVGMDKSDLRKAVDELSTPEQNAELLLTKLEQEEKAKPKAAAVPSAAATTTTTTNGSQQQFSKEQLQSNAERLSSMDPAMLRQQAAMLKTMPCSELRRMNPMFANMTDAQIRQAAAQFELMAENPAMVQAAAEQMKSMSPDQVEAQAALFNGQQQQSSRSNNNSSTTGASAATSSSTATAPAAMPPSNPADMLSQMNPEQLKTQAQMMKNMSPDQIRSMSPQFANMTDQQISQISAQMEMMANNPAMMSMVAEQMKNMSPEDIQAMQEGRLPSSLGGGGEGGGLDPAKLLSSMKGKDIKQMLRTAKENPDMLRTAMPNGDTSAVEGIIDRLEGMDEKTLDWIVSILAKLAAAAQPLWRGYTSLNKAVGGHLLKLLVGLPVAWLLYRWLGPSSSYGASISSASITEEIPVLQQVEEPESEF